MTGFAGGLGTGIVLTTAKMEAGNLYLDLQEQGISDDTAVPIAVGAGLLNGVVEAVGMKVAAAPFRQLAVRVMREQIAEAIQKPTMRAALAAAGKAYVVQVGSEATEEGLQEIVNIAGEELAKGMEGIDSETTMRDAAKRVLDSFVQGAMGGSILGGIGPGANLYVDLRRANKATKQTRFFDDLSKNATESKLKARDAGAYERFVAATADGTGADTVFVDGATIRDVLTQAGVTDTQLDAIIPGMAQQVRQAVELGNDVTLPTSQFAARLAGTKLGDALMPHMRLSPDAMSAMEAQQFEQSREALVEEARALLDAKTEAESAFVQEADQIASSMRDRLVAAGRDPAMAEVEALVHQAFVVTQAARRGMTPSQFEAESGLREIVGVPQVGAPMEQAAIPKPSARVVELLPTSQVLDERGFGPITHPVDGDEVAAGRAMRTVLGGIDVPRKYLKTQEAFDYLLGAINQVLLNKSKDSADYDRAAASMGRALRTDLATVDDIVISAKKLGYAGIDQDFRIETEDTLTKTDVMEVLDQIPIAPEMFDQAARIDADYLAAVERGDMEAAQRMVDEAAKASGLTEIVWRGDRNAAQITEYRRGARREPGIFTTTNQYVADKYAGKEGGARRFYVGGRTLDLTNQTPKVIAWIRKWSEDGNWDFVDRASGESVTPEDAVMSGRLYNWEGTWSGQRWKDIQATAAEDGYDIVKLIDEDKDAVDGTFISTVVLNENKIKLADPVTYDEQGNIVPLSRRFDITSPKVFEQAAAGPRLMAVHNLSADNLAFAERMGGLAVPSIGVVTEQAGGVEGFGEITLLGTREMAEPRTTPVFEADAYSARFPRPEWPKVSTAKADAVVASIRDLQTEFDDVGLVDSTFNFLVNEPDANKLAERWLRSPAIMAMYLRERGIEIAPILETRPTLSRLTWEAIDRLTPIYLAVDQQQAYDVMEASPEYAALKVAYADEVRSQYQGVAEELPEGRVEEWATQFTPTTLQRLSRDVRETNRQRVAREATADAITEKLEPLYAEYKTWVDQKTREQFGAPFLRDGKLKRPYTLGNIVDFMASAKVKGEEKGLTFGAGAARAKRARAFPDLEEMREAAKTAIVNPDEYSKARKESEKTLEAYRLAVVDYTRLTDYRGKQDTWAAMDGSMKALARYGKRKKRNAKAMREALSREQFAIGSMPAETIEQAIDAADALFNAPVPYFEAKPQRAVRLNEFAGAVIPTDASQQTRDILERSGIPYMSYMAGNEQDRQMAVRQMAVSPEARGEVLFQAAPGPARGGYDPARLKILFGPGADFTTGAHELTHFYVDYYTRQAMAGTATPQMLADLDAMFKFMGVAGDTPEARMAAFNAMPFETSRPLIETITYNAEIYLFEGKAPSLELAGVFDRMLAFFRRAYKSIADFITQQQAIYRREFGRELPVLNDELRAVFDRMLADEQQIKQAQAVAQMRGQFTVKPEGMDDAEWAAYQEMAGEATNAAIADMTKASLRQMEWLSRARSRIIKDMQERHTAQRKEVRERVQREVQQDPLYLAMAFLKRAQIVAPDGATTKAEGVHRIDRVLAAEFAPTVDLARLGGRFGVLQDDGLHPDVVAEMFGYPAGASLLQALADAKPMREVVEDRTDAEMLRVYGEMNTPEAREQEIQKALHNEARARLVGVELRFMGKIRQPVRVLMEAARQAAQQVIDRKRVGELRPSEFIAAEAKASREATAAMQDNKPDMAVRAKRAQLLNNQLAKTALEVRDEIDDGVRYLRRVLRDSNRQRMGADVADQIAGLLDRFNIAPMTADEANRVRTLSEFLASLEDRGLVPDIAEAIGMRDTRIPYKNMNIADFRDLVDAIKQLEYIGKNERKILLAKEKAEFQAVRDEIVKSVVDNAGDRKANARTATTNIGRAVTAMKGFAAAHLKAASIVRIMDGGKDGGPLWNYLIRSANEAGDTETTMRAEATADLTKILEPVFRAGKLGGKGIFFPTINRAMNREARLVVALNMGNAGNMQRLLDGEGWSIESVLPVLQSLTEDELNTVQQIWDYFEKYRPMIGQKERRLYGKEPAWVEPQPLVVQSADGKTVTLRGGYYPIKYDPRASQRAETMSEADEAKRDLAGSYTTATTRRSFVKSRVRKVEDQPLLYTLAGMYSGINDVIHDLTWHEWLIQANRLMRSKSFDEAVRNRYGPEYVAQLKNWIKDVAAGERGVQNEAEMALNFLRQGISSAGLGFNIVSAAMQITGFNQSIVRVGARWIGRGIAYVAQNPMIAMREVNEKSEFMRNRSRTQFRELNEIRNMVQGQSVAMRRVQMGTYFLMMRMQRMVDVPTWHGAYEKAMYEGRDEETAIALADQAVIDSQGGGMVKDLARVERGGPAVKLFTVFYGYMNTVYNMAAVQTMTNKNKGRLAADYVMLFVVPVVLTYMLKQALIPRKGGEDEEWDMSKIARELAAEQLSYLMGTMVIAREFGEVGKMIFGVEGPRMGYGGPAGLRAVGETYQFATQASQGEFDTAFRKSAVNMIGAFTGLPSAQVNRTLDGLEALYEGETKNVLAPLTGAKKR
jgi:hypothetical protein